MKIGDKVKTRYGDCGIVLELNGKYCFIKFDEDGSCCTWPLESVFKMIDIKKIQDRVWLYRKREALGRGVCSDLIWLCDSLLTAVEAMNTCHDLWDDRNDDDIGRIIFDALRKIAGEAKE